VRIGRTDAQSRAVAPGTLFLLPTGRPRRLAAGAADFALAIHAGGRPRRFAPPAARRSRLKIASPSWTCSCLNSLMILCISKRKPLPGLDMSKHASIRSCLSNHELTRHVAGFRTATYRTINFGQAASCKGRPQEKCEPIPGQAGQAGVAPQFRQKAHKRDVK
jgi:hypothetical protein